MKRIPEEAIKHLGSQGKEERERQHILALTKHGSVWRRWKTENYPAATANTLEAALEAAGDTGRVANLPLLIAARATNDRTGALWRTKLNAYSEEHIGVDTHGAIVKPGSYVGVVIHGAAILTPEYMKQHHEKTEEDPRAEFGIDQETFDKLLQQELPGDSPLKMYSVDEALRGEIYDIFGTYGIWFDPLRTGISMDSALEKDAFTQNRLVVARAGSNRYLSDYFEKANLSTGRVSVHTAFSLPLRDRAFSNLLYVDKPRGKIAGTANIYAAEYVAYKEEEEQ